MRKRISIYLLIACVLSATILLAGKAYRINRAKKIMASPPLDLQAVKQSDIIWGDPGILENAGEILLVRFSPDCEFCQHDAQAIVNRMPKKLTLVFSSSANKESIVAFIKDKQLSRLPKCIVLRDSLNTIAGGYGCNIIPSFFLFNQKQELEKKCCGSVRLSLLSDEFKNENDTIH